MSVTSTVFGKLPGGQTVEKITLAGAGDLEVALITYGGAVQAIRYAGKDVALGFDTLEDYWRCTSFQGAMIGRYGNRIAGGRFSLNGEVFDVGCNEGGFGHLHGGEGGFHTRLWTATVIDAGDEPTVRLSYHSADGEEGYPGDLDVCVDVSVTADDILRFRYFARSTKDTVVNLTNHTYFNPHGWQNGDILDVELQINADAITPVNRRFIPTGEITPVVGTPFDFHTPKPIGRDMDLRDEQLAICGGYDHNFVLGKPGESKAAARAISHKSGIGIECVTDQPGMQVYVSNSLREPAGKGGVALYKHQGLCMETQHYPDSPNHPHFPTTTLKAGEEFHSETAYRFFKI
ncbi:MAG: aldose epimerase family protein [Acutalibacteraceae bacterium]